MNLSDPRSPVTLTLDGAVAVATLNRPDQANVLSADTRDALIAATAAIRQGVAAGCVRAVLLCGRGGHFCAGGDIRAFAASEDLSARLDRALPEVHESIRTLAALPVPVVSAINGSIGGGGIGLALCADIGLAAESMKLRGGYSAIGLSPDLGVSWALTRLAGPMRTKQILFTNRMFSAQECLAMGLVAEIHPDAALSGAAHSLAARLANGATGSFARIKTQVDLAWLQTLEQHLAVEHADIVAAADSADAREGALAFLEKRTPRFGRSHSSES